MKKDTKPNSLKGIHLIKFFESEKDNLITLDVHEHRAFAIPYSQIENCHIYNSNEIMLQLELGNQDEKTSMLSEARFFYPTEKKTNNNKDYEDNELNEAESVYFDIREKAKLDEKLGEIIATLERLPLAVPRGRYTFDLYRDHMRLHGSTYHYKVMYKNIIKAFLLPLSDDVKISLVLGFDRPLRQGTTSYPYIVINFKKTDKISVDIQIKEKKLKDVNKDLKPFYEGFSHETVANLFKMIVGINIIIPGNFRTTKKHSSFKCSVKNQQGQFFPLNKSIIFIWKPVIYIKLNTIARVEFQRVTSGVTMRGFDFEVYLDSGDSYIFSGIDKIELDNFMEYLEQSKIVFKTIGEDVGNYYETLEVGGDKEDDEEDDEEYVVGGNNEDDEDYEED